MSDLKKGKTPTEQEDEINLPSNVTISPDKVSLGKMKYSLNRKDQMLVSRKLSRNRGTIVTLESRWLDPSSSLKENLNLWRSDLKLDYSDPTKKRVPDGEKILSHVDDEHVRTRELVIEKYEKLYEVVAKKEDIINAKEEIIKHNKAELAKKEDIINAKEEIIKTIKNESELTKFHFEKRIKELQVNLARFLPYKRTFKASVYFLVFFLGSISSELFLSVTIIQPFWAWLGLGIATGFLLMSYFIYLEWEKKLNNERTSP